MLTIFRVLPVREEHVLSRPNRIVLNCTWLRWSRHAWMECRQTGTCCAYYTLAFAFKLVENSTENTPERVVEKYQLARFIMLIWPSVDRKYWQLCWPLGTLGRSGSTLGSIGICRATNCLPHHPTFSPIFRLEAWCVRQIMEIPDPWEFACYQCTKI